MLKGSCLCGSVKYEADCDPGIIIHCHCQTCRKAHSAAFSSLMPVARDAFRWTAGEDVLSRFESSPGKNRHFCTRCGSQLIAERQETDIILLRMGCMDTKIAQKPDAHIWRSDAAPWFDPDHKIRQLPEGYEPA
ncbi:MAG: GFA family protein [Pseudomonadota bacterium]